MDGKYHCDRLQIAPVVWVEIAGDLQIPIHRVWFFQKIRGALPDNTTGELLSCSPIGDNCLQMHLSRLRLVTERDSFLFVLAAERDSFLFVLVATRHLLQEELLP